ncbi:MAG TPA: hypothetical protein VIO94_14070 [Phenylobacterium sp.]
MASHDPAPSHLDTRDPSKPDRMPIREEVDRELAAYPDADGLVLLTPEDCWTDLARQLGADAGADEIEYRGVRLRKAAVTAVVAQDGF